MNIMLCFLYEPGGIIFVSNQVTPLSMSMSIVEDTCTEIVWSLSESSESSESKDNREIIKDHIESCCLLKKFTILCREGEGDGDGDELEMWAKETFKCVDVLLRKMKKDVLFVNDKFESISLHLPESLTSLVISNVCWCPTWPLEQVCAFLRDELGIRKLNICLSCIDPTWKSTNAHSVRELRKKIDELGMEVVSVNGLFSGRDENLFEDYGSFHEHFKQMIHYAHFLGAKYVIYGSASSKNIHARRIHEYGAYKRAHNMFASTFKELGAEAARFGITILIKPNANDCNYLMMQQQVEAMIGEIESDAVIEMPMRSPIICEMADLKLLELGCRFTDFDSFRRYLNPLVRFLLDGSSGQLFPVADVVDNAPNDDGQSGAT